ncbi:MAG: hypothetical protein IPI89_09000, partial [Propionivibrio sp.]|nr:hypothetical protein [Propionivibrio sp.]
MRSDARQVGRLTIAFRVSIRNPFARSPLIRGLLNPLTGQSMKNQLALPTLLVTLVAMWSAPIRAADADGRQFVEMPPEARAELRAEMLDFQSALHLIIGALAEQQFATAAETAENQMGVS